MTDLVSPPPRVAILANPSAGRHHPGDLDRLAARLADLGCVVETVVGHFPGDLARAAATLDVDVVAVAGGDGTLNSVVGALVGREGARPRLAVIPQGTANVMVAEYDLPTRVEPIAEAIRAVRTRPLHLGRASRDGEPPRPFFLATSAGFDAEVVHHVERKVKRRFKKLAFVVTALHRGLRRRPPVEAVVIGPDGTETRLRLGLAIVAKSSRYGGPFRLTKGTAMDRPGLRLVGLERVDVPALLGAAVRLGLGRLEGAPNVVSLPVARASLATLGRNEIAVQVDGDPHGMTPVVVEAMTEALEVVVA
ncbi:MAG: diacylglycerol kinase family lipid kinase [Hyphomicrobiales bacterium]|nr:diacylglycerol kinase family lipid kinase [Hyphomicrobiales bacterium]